MTLEKIDFPEDDRLTVNKIVAAQQIKDTLIVA